MQKLAAHFIPAADASDRLQSRGCKDEDALLFQKFGGKRTVPSQRAGDGLGQGQYAVAPGGALLASCATAEPREVARMLREALAAWEKLPREKRLLAKSPDPKAAERWRRWEKLYPEDGLVLWVVSRDLPRAKVAPHFRGAWNQDFAWFKKDEARAFLPADPEPGARHEVPRRLVGRLARFHLLDNVRALNYAFFPEGAVEKAALTSEVVDVRGGLVSLRLEGATRAAQTETPHVAGERGYDARLLGRATFDLGRRRFTAFELVAVGTRWGQGSCNLRHDDPGPAPMGVLLTLAGGSAAERLPPAFVSRYGWD